MGQKSKMVSVLLVTCSDPAGVSENSGFGVMLGETAKLKLCNVKFMPSLCEFLTSAHHRR